MAWKAEYVIIILISTSIDYWCGRKMGALPNKKQRKPYLYLSLASNLGILFTFKYFDFFIQSFQDFFNLVSIPVSAPVFSLILPMGISFYTFQTLSYSIDIYYGKIKPEKHFGIFSLFVTFFPQLVAGPIERASHLLPQFKKTFKFDSARVSSGFRLMLWGFFKKIVIADKLSILVDSVYSNVYMHQGLTLWIATLFFAFQIYCDFSGYTDIAIGAARILGFDIMKNFRMPYFSASISEFWKRWHISLSTWFKDYVYIPLGGNRTVKWKWYYNLIITFLVSGLWHGANWTFVMWGFLHGMYLVVALYFSAAQLKIKTFIVKYLSNITYKRAEVIFVFVLVCFTWIFFRANSITEAFYVVKATLSPNAILNSLLAFKSVLFNTDYTSMNALYNDILINDTSIGMNLFDFVQSNLLIMFLLTIELFDLKRGASNFLDSKSRMYRWAIYIVFIYIILFFGEFGYNEFIYFQF